MAYTLLSEKQSLTKKDEKGNDELADTLLSEKKTSTNKLEKGTDKKAGTLFSEKKPLTKDAEKCTYELAFKKKGARNSQEGFKSSLSYGGLTLKLI